MTFSNKRSPSVSVELEVVAALVARQSQEDHPLARIAEERFHAILAHVGSDGQRIYVVLFKECTRVHNRSVANIATLGIGDDEVVGVVIFQIGYRLLEGHHATHAHALVESQVGLVGHTIGSGSVDNGLVELEDGVVLLAQVLREFAHIGIQSYTKKRLFIENLID